jgi:prepilin-type N-terminal cleavage/methylation domain-containing protein
LGKRVNKAAFTMLEMIFVMIVIGIISVIIIFKYFTLSQQAHEAVLISFVRMLNRTAGIGLWNKSLNENHHGDISYIHSVREMTYIPFEINGTDIDLKDCNSTTMYHKIAESNTKITKKMYIIECKNGTPKGVPFFRLIRVEDNKILVKRE